MPRPKKNHTAQERSEIARKNAMGSRPRERLWTRHPTGICGVPGCGRKHFMKDMCEMHHSRWKRTGSVGLIGPKNKQSGPIDGASREVIARPPRAPTPRAEKAAEKKGLSFVQRERERRKRKETMMRVYYGSNIPYVRLDDGLRVVYAKANKEVLADEWAIQALERTGLLVDNGAGVLVAAPSSPPALPEREVATGQDASEPVSEAGPDHGGAAPVPSGL